MCNNIN